MALPRPVWSDDDIRVVKNAVRNPSSLIWNTWTKDPTKIAVLRAMVSCQDRINGTNFDWDMFMVLAQKSVCFLHSYSLEAEKVHH